MSLTPVSIDRKLLLFCTLLSKIVDRGYANSKCMGNMHNDLKFIDLAYCMVIG